MGPRSATLVLALLLASACGRGGFVDRALVAPDDSDDLSPTAGNDTSPDTGGADDGDSADTDAQDGDSADTDAQDGDGADTDAQGGDPAPPCPPPATSTAIVGATYYVSPAGSDGNAGTTRDAPWATFAHAFTVLGPGDGLILLDGVYAQGMAPQVSGSPGLPIVLRAETDGGAIIDGEFTRSEVCLFQGASSVNRLTDIVLEGVHCRNALETAAGGEGPVLIYMADRITLRRVTATSPGADVVFGVGWNGTSDVLLEDVAAWGRAIHLFGLGGDRTVLRRCYGYWTESQSIYPTIVNVEDMNDGRVENCIGFSVNEGSSNLSHFSVYGPVYPTDRNVFQGCVARGTVSCSAFTISGDSYRITSNAVRDSVGLVPGFGLFHRADDNLSVSRVTFLTPGQVSVGVSPASTSPNNQVGLSFTGSILMSASTGFEVSPDNQVLFATHDDNVLFQVTTPYVNTSAGANELTVDPSFDTATYGNGAYLMRPAAAQPGSGMPLVGAEILYRTVDGVLTSVPLWPWPMEDRIMAEAGISVTYEANGGLWKVLPPLTCQ